MKYNTSVMNFENGIFSQKENTSAIKYWESLVSVVLRSKDVVKAVSPCFYLKGKNALVTINPRYFKRMIGTAVHISESWFLFSCLNDISDIKSQEKYLEFSKDNDDAFSFEIDF